jgi:hypothetical protein
MDDGYPVGRGISELIVQLSYGFGSEVRGRARV